jgi:hypothetical protein
MVRILVSFVLLINAVLIVPSLWHIMQTPKNAT